MQGKALFYLECLMPCAVSACAGKNFVPFGAFDALCSFSSCRRGLVSFGVILYYVGFDANCAI